MYTLRRIFNCGFQTNVSLNDNYSLAYKGSAEFEKAYKELDDDSITIYAFVNSIPLYRNSSYYIMTESGKTFSNLTFK